MSTAKVHTRYKLKYVNKPCRTLPVESITIRVLSQEDVLRLVYILILITQQDSSLHDGIVLAMHEPDRNVCVTKRGIVTCTRVRI